MAIVRKHVGPRMSQVVINRGVAYLAGQCAEGATAADVNTKINSEPTVDNRFRCMTCLASWI